MATLTGGNLDALRDRLRQTSAGSISVVDAQVESRLDPDGEEYVQVNLVISEPPPGQQTWSLDDAFQLRQTVRRTAAELGLPFAVSIVMTTSGDNGTAEDDRDDDDDPTQAGGG